jgi:hypothetical protein
MADKREVLWIAVDKFAVGKDRHGRVALKLDYLAVDAPLLPADLRVVMTMTAVEALDLSRRLERKAQDLLSREPPRPKQ